MKNQKLKIFIGVYLLLLFLISNSLIWKGLASTELINPELSSAPVVDGFINNSINEWNGATKKSTFLFPAESQNGLFIKLWVIQNSSILYISVQYELEEHNSSEFIGILISNEVESISDDLDDSDFFDAKIVQFKNISLAKYEYLDLYINNTKYYNDTITSGSGATKIMDKSAIYEFSMPIANINASDDIEDVFLEVGKTYGFKLVYGTTATNSTNSFSTGIKLSTIVFINIKYEPPGEPEIDMEQVLLILTIVIFSIIGALYVFYLYEMVGLRKKVRRVKR